MCEIVHKNLTRRRAKFSVENNGYADLPTMIFLVDVSGNKGLFIPYTNVNGDGAAAVVGVGIEELCSSADFAIANRRLAHVQPFWTASVSAAY